MKISFMHLVIDLHRIPKSVWATQPNGVLITHHSRSRESVCDKPIHYAHVLIRSEHVCRGKTLALRIGKPRTNCLWMAGVDQRAKSAHPRVCILARFYLFVFVRIRVGGHCSIRLGEGQCRSCRHGCPAWVTLVTRHPQNKVHEPREARFCVFAYVCVRVCVCLGLLEQVICVPLCPHELGISRVSLARGYSEIMIQWFS